MLQNDIAISDSPFGTFPNRALNSFEQQLLGQNDVASEAFAKTRIGACTHSGETLIRGDGPGVDRSARAAVSGRARTKWGWLVAENQSHPRAANFL